MQHRRFRNGFSGIAVALATIFTAPLFAQHSTDLVPSAAARRHSPVGFVGLESLKRITSQAFATEIQNLFFTRFEKATPEILENIGPFTELVWAGDFVGGDAERTYNIRDDNNLVTIDINTGAETLIGPMTTPPGTQIYTGMTFDRSTGHVYATSCDRSRSLLWMVDVSTATATQVGTITNSPCSSSLAADDAGNLYSHDTVDDTLIFVDKATGAGAVVGGLGFDARAGQGMDFNDNDGVMYLATFNNTSFQAELREVDLVTGETTLIGVLGATVPGGLVQLGWISFAPTAATVGSCADFESGVLPSYMFAETVSAPPANGRVQVTTAFPYSGSWALDVDTDCPGCGGPTLQAAVMRADLAGESHPILRLWIHEHGDENDPEDGIFISDDGGTTWAQIFSFNGLPSDYVNVSIDLEDAAQAQAMTLVDGFLISLQGADNFSIPSDGYSFDDICLLRPQVFADGFESGDALAWSSSLPS